MKTTTKRLLAAHGCATNQVNTTNERNQNTSAGTVYLQGQSDGEKGGTIYVKNQKSYDTSNVATWLPAGTLGDAAEDFKKAAASSSPAARRFSS